MKEDRITAKEEVWATPKHLHTIPTTRGNFSSKIGKSGGGRREIEWGVGRGGAVGGGRVRARGRRMREERSHPLFIPSHNLHYRYYRWRSTGTTGQVDNGSQATREKKNYQSPGGTTGGSSAGRSE